MKKRAEIIDNGFAELALRVIWLAKGVARVVEVRVLDAETADRNATRRMQCLRGKELIGCPVTEQMQS